MTDHSSGEANTANTNDETHSWNGRDIVDVISDDKALLIRSATRCCSKDYSIDWSVVETGRTFVPSDERSTAKPSLA